MTDNYIGAPSKFGQPGRKCIAVALSDTVDLADGVSRLYISVAGNLKFTAAGDADGTSTTVAVVAGQVFPWLVKRVWAATTATAFIIH